MGTLVGVKCHRSWVTSYVMLCSAVGELSLARLRSEWKDTKVIFESSKNNDKT